MKKAIACLVVLVGCWNALASAAAVDDARAFFERYVELERVFDPTIADLYADDAGITNKRTFPSGEVRVLSMAVDKYKQVLRQAMPLAQARGDLNSYSEVTYTVEGTSVRIHAVRFNVSKKYTSSISWLVGPDAKGRWLIHEETSESQGY